MTELLDPIMDGVYEVRQRVSAECGHDPDVYSNLLHREQSAAREAGMTYLQYCLGQLSDETSDNLTAAAASGANF